MQNIFKRFYDYFKNPAKAGQSTQDIHNKNYDLAVGVEKLSKTQNFQLRSIALGNSESHIDGFIAPFKCRVLKVRAAVPTAATGSAATATLSFKSNYVSTPAAKNPLSGTNIDLDALAATDAAEAQALSTDDDDIVMAEGDHFKCTFACDGSSTLPGGAVVEVEVEPIE